MRIIVGNLHAKVAASSSEEEEWLREYLSFPDYRSRFRPGGDGRVRMYNLFNASFPAGLVALVKKAGPEAGYPVEIVEKAEIVAPLPPEEVDLAWLREGDQIKAVQVALERRRGILHLPTSFGKTEVAVGLIRAVPAPWLFVVHRTTLAVQAAERFERRNREHGIDLGPVGIIGEGNWTEGERLTCATFASLRAALKKKDPRCIELLKRIRGLIVDEAHTLPADSHWAVCMATPNAGYRFGLSGTPLARGDRRSVLAIAALGPVIYRVKTSTLVESGQAAKSKIKFVEVEQQSGAPTFNGVYGALVVRSAARNKALVEIAKKAEKPALLFVKEVAHGRALEKMLLSAGVRSNFVYGTHSEDWRKTAIGQLTRGAIDVLVTSVVFQEGVDIPSLRSVINGAGGRSTIAALQRLGRGMRIERDSAGNVIKDSFEAYDIFDRGHEWLERASRERRAAFVKEGHEVEVVSSVG